MQITKQLLKNIKSACNIGVDKDDIKNSRVSSWCENTNEWFFFVYGKHCCIRYFGLSEEQENQIKSVIEQYRQDAAIQNGTYFYECENYSSIYPKEQYVKFTLKEIEDKIKQFKNDLGRNTKYPIDVKFSNVYNLETLLKTARCIDDKEITVKFPKRTSSIQELKVIVLSGSKGDAIILPSRQRGGN